MICWKPYWVC